MENIFNEFIMNSLRRIKPSKLNQLKLIYNIQEWDVDLEDLLSQICNLLECMDDYCVNCMLETCIETCYIQDLASMENMEQCHEKMNILPNKYEVRCFETSLGELNVLYIKKNIIGNIESYNEQWIMNHRCAYFCDYTSPMIETNMVSQY